MYIQYIIYRDGFATDHSNNQTFSAASPGINKPPTSSLKWTHLLLKTPGQPGIEYTLVSISRISTNGCGGPPAMMGRSNASPVAQLLNRWIFLELFLLTATRIKRFRRGQIILNFTTTDH